MSPFAAHYNSVHTEATPSSGGGRQLPHANNFGPGGDLGDVFRAPPSVGKYGHLEAVSLDCFTYLAYWHRFQLHRFHMELALGNKKFSQLLW